MYLWIVFQVSGQVLGSPTSFTCSGTMVPTNFLHDTHTHSRSFIFIFLKNHIQIDRDYVIISLVAAYISIGQESHLMLIDFKMKLKSVRLYSFLIVLCLMV